jgi:hypothetical protein
MKRLLILLCLMLLGSAATVLAQPPTIAFGSFTAGSISAATPAQVYTFDGAAGDLVSVEAIAVSSTLDPRLSLQIEGGTALAETNDDPFQPGSRDARVTYRLPKAGVYTLVVEGQERSTGEFLLRLERRVTTPATPLGVDVITAANLSPDIRALTYSFDSAVGTHVSVSSAVRGFPFIAEVRSPDGQTLAVQSSSLVQSAGTTVAANTGTYEVVVQTLNPNAQGVLDVLFSSSNAAPTPTPAPAIVEAAPTFDPAATAVTDNTATVFATATPSAETSTVPTDAQATPTVGTPADNSVGVGAPEDRCSVIAEVPNGVVIRSGAGSTFGVIGSIPNGGFRYADGFDGAWYRLVGGGWVSSGVVTPNPACATLQRVSDPQTVITSPAATATTFSAIGTRP